MSRRFGPALGLLTAGRLVVNIGQRFVYPFLPVIARGLGVSLQAAGFLVSARWAVGLATPAVVAVVGRGERRRRTAVFGLACFAGGAAMTAASGIYVGALFGFMLMGLGKPSYDVSAQAYVADRTPYERRARYLSVLELTWAGGLLIGAPLAGWLIDRFGWASPFWFLAAAAAVVIVAIPAVLDGDPAPGSAGATPLRWTGPALSLLAVVALFTLAGELMFIVFGAWLEDSYGLELLGLGTAAVVVGLAELAGEGTTLVVTDRIGKRRAVAIGLTISIVGFALLATSPSTVALGVALLALALFGFEFTIVSAIPLATELQPAARARYLSWFIVAMALARTLGAAVGPQLFEWSGLPGVAVAAVVVDVAALAVLLVRLGIRRPLPTAAAGEAAVTGTRGP